MPTVQEGTGSPRRPAELLGADPAQIERWQVSEGIDQANAERVGLLEVVMAHLLRLHSSETAQRWLFGLNPNLGGRRPMDLSPRRQTGELLDAIANERAGSFAVRPVAFCRRHVATLRYSWHLPADAGVRRRFSPIAPSWWC